MEPDLGAVQADQRLVQRVVENLIANAYQHAGAGVIVTVRAWRDDGRAVFAVQDNGAGIRPEDRERVFELFEHASNGPRGSGLGLTFCKVAVERHGGWIWIQDAPSGGTQVCFTLPLAPMPSGAAA